MADTTKNQDNKDAEQSGRPVQLDREQQGGKGGRQQGGKSGQQQGGQQQGGQQDRPGQDQQGGHDMHQDKQGTQHGQNR